MRIRAIQARDDPAIAAVIRLYERSGSRRIDAPLGDCNTFHLRDP